MSRHPYFADVPTPRVLAHRGLVTADAAEDCVVENSALAVAAAEITGCGYVESDCHLTADGTVVLLHDPDLTRVAGDPRPVAEVTERELAAMFEDRGGLLTLADALASFPGLRFNLDVKAAAAAIPTGQLVAAHGARVLLTSFSDMRRRAALAAAAAEDPEQMPATSGGTGVVTRVMAATALGSRHLAAQALRGIDALQLPDRQGIVPVVTPRLIRFAHAAGTEVHVWTVNDPANMRRLVGLGVDGIVTDDAELALRTLAPPR